LILQALEFPNAVVSAVVACKNGIKRTHIVDARIDGGLLLELYSRDGVGTMISTDFYEGIRGARSTDLENIMVPPPSHHPPRAPPKHMIRAQEITASKPKAFAAKDIVLESQDICGCSFHQVQKLLIMAPSADLKNIMVLPFLLPVVDTSSAP